MRDDGRIAVQAEAELGQVVGADREAVEDLQELIGEQCVGRHFAHHDDLQAVLALLQAVLFQHLDDLAAFFQGAHERNHDPQVVQAHFVAHAQHGLAFQREGGREARIDVTAGAAEADHRVLFVRLVVAAADKVGVLVGLEVRQAHDHRVRCDRGGEGGDAFGQAVHVEADRITVTGNLLVDLLLGRRILAVVFQQRVRVDADVAGDDHFQTSQADAGVRQLAEVEGTFRVGHVHHDLQRCRRHVAQIGGGALEIELAFVDEAGIAFSAADGDLLAIFDDLGGVARTDHGRHAQLARDDRGVAGTATTVGDDGRGTLHHRLPVGVGHVSDQHVARLHAVHVVQRLDHAGGARADLRADGTAFGQHIAALFSQRETLDLGGVAARLHRFRARLHDEQLAADTVLGPLDVHRAAVVLFDDQRLLGQFLHVLVADGEGAAQFDRGVLDPDALAGDIRIHHADRLAAERAAQDRRLAGLQGGLVDVVLVRVDRALHDHFAQAEGRGDEHHVTEAGLGVQGEQYAGGTDARTHHQLHAGGQEHVLVLEAVVHAVGDGAVVVQRGEHFLDLVHDIVSTGHVEEGFLLAGEGRIGQIFGGGRGAHRNGHFAAAVLVAQLLVGAADVLVQLRLQRGIDHPGADFLAGNGQRVDVFDVERGQLVEDALGQVVVGNEVLEGFGGRGVTAGDGDPQTGKVADHFAQRRILAAYAGQIAQTQFVQPQDVLVQARCSVWPSPEAG